MKIFINNFEGSNLQDIGEFSKPDIQKDSWLFKLDIFQLRTAFDLFNAHFCAKHFSKATTLFEFVCLLFDFINYRNFYLR